MRFEKWKYVVKWVVIETTFTMLVDVETFFLDALIHTQSMDFLYWEEQNHTRYGCPEVDTEHSESLRAEHIESTAIEQTAVGSNLPYFIHETSIYFIFTPCW